MTMAHLLIAGTHRGTTTVVVTANVKGKDLRAIAVIIILAGLFNGVSLWGDLWKESSVVTHVSLNMVWNMKLWKQSDFGS